MTDPAFLITCGMILIFMGFIILAAGMMRSKIGEERSPDQGIKEEKVKGGGVILIGPVPIVFGYDKRYAIIAMVLAIIIMALAIVFMRY